MTPPAAIEVAGITDTQGTIIPDPFLLPLRANKVYGRRKKALNSQWGIAAPARSSSFKHATFKSKPKAKRWDREQARIIAVPELHQLTTYRQITSAWNREVERAVRSREQRST
jgi:hypothetical protein